MHLHFDIESLTTLQPVIKNYVAGPFTSSPTHRCLHVESAKKAVNFCLVGISDPGTRNPI